MKNKAKHIVISTVLIISTLGLSACGENVEQKITSSQSQSASNETVQQTQTVVPLKVGETIIMGSYERKGLEWVVLKVEDGKVLITTTNAVCKKQYNNTAETVTWETCSLRNWLNNDFYKTAFTEEEKAKIVEANVKAEGSSDFITLDQGRDTLDKVFLLSMNEASAYFSAKEDRIIQYNGKNCYWWLRSIGQSKGNAASVDGTGRYVDSQYDVGEFGIRPVMWIAQ